MLAQLQKCVHRSTHARAWLFDTRTFLQPSVCWNYLEVGEACMFPQSHIFLFSS